MKIYKRRHIISLYICILCIFILARYMGAHFYKAYVGVSADAEKKYIRWIDFDVTSQALTDAVRFDVESYGGESHVDHVTLLSLLAVKYGGSFKGYKKADMQKLYDALRDGKKPEELTQNTKLLNYYLEAYSAVLDGFVGEYGVQKSDTDDGLFYEKRYGLKAFSPIAAGYYYEDYDDFGAPRSFGYKRAHLGHDMLGSVGTPIVAVEGGYVEACGWNRFGGWRIGIRSLDNKRYYYYAHLRKGHPFNDMYEGKLVEAGEVIGYLGMTGYSSKEDTNNINVPHLHFGLQIIFDPSQKEGVNQIWIDAYELTKFLSANRSEVVYDKQSGEFSRKNPIIDLSLPD